MRPPLPQSEGSGSWQKGGLAGELHPDAAMTLSEQCFVRLPPLNPKLSRPTENQWTVSSWRTFYQILVAQTAKIMKKKRKEKKRESLRNNLTGHDK